MSDQTPNEVVQRALARRRELEDKLRKLDTFLEVYRLLDTDLSPEPSAAPNTNATNGTGSADHSQPTADEPIRKARVSSGISQVDYEKLIHNILTENGRPLQREAILDRIHERGLQVGGSKEWENHKAKLWRAKAKGHFVLIPGAGYWPREIPCPSVHYVPDESYMN